MALIIPPGWETPGGHAANKSAIIKSPCVAVSAPSQPVEVLGILMERAAKEGVPLILPRMEAVKVRQEGLDGSVFTYGEYQVRLSLLGARQRENAVTAIETARACLPGLSAEAVERAWRGRGCPAGRS